MIEDAILNGGNVAPVWLDAYFVAEKWGIPPWLIMCETDNAWTKIKWVKRHTFITSLLYKRAEREARLQKVMQKHNNKHGKYR